MSNESATATTTIPEWKRGATPVARAGHDFLVRGDIAFLNHGSFGARPRPVFEAYQRWQRELEAQPVEFLARRLPDLLAEARARLAGYLGAGVDEIVFAPNATHGMNIIARSLELSPGDEALGADHEYGAVERTWRFICGERGATYRVASLPLGMSTVEEVVERLWEGVTPRTRVIVLSHISSPTALRFPIEAVCRRAREQGILTAIDGAHAPGQIALDLHEIGADFYVGNCHKWLCAPVGAGFLYARPERQALLKPLVVSWGWEPRQPGPSPFIDLFDWIGTDDPAAYLSVPAAIAYQQEHDWPAVRSACHALAREAREKIGALTRLPHICPDSPDWWAQMFAAPIPTDTAMSGEELQRRLRDEYQVEVPITEWQGRRCVRVSIQAYNSAADVERLMEGLRALL